MAIQSQGLRQVQKQTQNLVLAPQLRQSLKILQVPAIELRSAILEELQTNPLLEELGNNDESLDAEEREPSPDEIENDSNEEFPEEPPAEAEVKDSEAQENDADGESPDDPMDLDFSDEFAVLNEMQEDMREHFENEFEGDAQLGNSDAQDKRKFFFDSLTSETSLQEHLIDQLKLTEISDNVRSAAEYIIGSLDENGFLNTDLSDIALLSMIPLADLQEALATLQTFDPIGIASINLQDCLLKQMDAREWTDTVQYAIVKDFFPFNKKEVPNFLKLSQPTDIIHESIEKISELDPSPGKRFSEDNNQSVSADATVEKVGDEWAISLNNDFIPRLKINRTYKELIAKGVLQVKKEYVRNQMRAGKFLLVQSIKDKTQLKELLVK